MNPAQRISDSADLGRRNRSIDIALGSVAVLPIIGASLDVWIAGPEALEVKTLAIEWSGGLLMFFAGVRRGLTFSEVSGGSPFELATMVWLFCLGMAALILISIPAAILGLVSVGILDFWAARAREAPSYFRLFRPLQMGLTSLSLMAILIRELVAPMG